MELFEHQKVMLKHHLSKLNTLDLSDVGTGKTAPVIRCIDELIKEGKIERVLVIAPNSILDNWANEIEQWSDLKYVILRGSKKRRIELLIQPEYADYHTEIWPNIYIINYEGIRVISPWLSVPNKPWDIIIADEVHHIKSYKAEQTKKILELAKKARARKALTGTLVTNDIEDVWSIAQFVDPQIFKTNYWGFRNHFMFNANAGKPWMNFPDWKAKPGAAEEIKGKLAPHAIRFEKREVMKWLPPVLFQKRYVELGEEQARVSKELIRHYIAELDTGEELPALHILARINKLMQIASGFTYRDGTTPYRFKQNKKKEETQELLTEIGDHQVLLWGAFKETILILHELLPDAKIIDGNLPEEERVPLCQSFNREEFQYIICSTGAAKEGLNILAPYAIFYDRNWKLLEYLQPLGRNDRPGAEKHQNISIFNLIAKDTVDERVMAALENKQDLLRTINPGNFREMLKI